MTIVTDEKELVRPYVLALERRRERVAEEATRRGLDALLAISKPVPDSPTRVIPAADMGDLAAAVRTYLAIQPTRPAAMWHCPVAGCLMAVPEPVKHPCPLRGVVPERPTLEVAR